MTPHARFITKAAVATALLTLATSSPGPSAAADPPKQGAAAPAPAKPAAKPAVKPGAGPRLKTVTLAIRHRVFHEFADQQAIPLNKDFLVGDTEFTARVIQYVPDFAMDLSTHKVVSRSQEPKNPAFKIVVREGKTYRDTTWAMLSLPPHFARNSYLAFKVMRIDFTDREALVADSAQAYKELEALKQAAMKMRPTEGEDPHGGMQSSPHGSMQTNPHGSMQTNPHGSTQNPHAQPPKVELIPSHGGTTKSGDKD